MMKVKRSIEDCKEMKGWDNQCQVYEYFYFAFYKSHAQIIELTFCFLFNLKSI